MQCVVDCFTDRICKSTANPCPGWYVLTPAEAANVTGQVTLESAALLGVTPESLATAFVAGFGWVFFLAFIGWCVALAISMIRKL